MSYDPTLAQELSTGLKKGPSLFIIVQFLRLALCRGLIITHVKGDGNAAERRLPEAIARGARIFSAVNPPPKEDLSMIRAADAALRRVSFSL